ncbi:MAG TPA: hypothetical protein VGD87_06520, partial [Archangium sp.]
MSFADRLSKRPPMPIEAKPPVKSALVGMCLPQMLATEGHAVGLVNLELAPILLGGMSAIRILDALDELFADMEAAADDTEAQEKFGPELFEAARLIRQHLESVSSASRQAHAEHEAKHQHGKE